MRLLQQDLKPAEYLVGPVTRFPELKTPASRYTAMSAAISGVTDMAADQPLSVSRGFNSGFATFVDYITLSHRNYRLLRSKSTPKF
jgi:hypothetical protein